MKILASSFVLIVLLMLGVHSTLSVTEDAMAMRQPTATPSVTEQPTVRIRRLAMADSTRLRYLQEHLNITRNELVQLSAPALRQLIEHNAVRLRVNVYEIDPQTNEYRLKARGRGQTNRVVTPTPPSSFISPLATPTPAARIQSSAGTLLTPRAYLPLVKDEIVVLPTPVLDQSTVQRRALSASNWIMKLTSGGSPNPFSTVFFKEQAGYPLWINNLSRPGDASYPRMVGHYMDGTHNHKFGYVEWWVSGDDFDWMDVRFEEGYAWNYDLKVMADRTYYGAGWDNIGFTLYHTCYLSYDMAESVDVFLNGTWLFNTWNDQPGICVEVLAGTLGGTHRYTVRHGQQLARNSRHTMADHDLAARTGQTADLLGYPWDLYDPIYGLNADKPDDFVFWNETYHDCDLLAQGKGINNPHPWGMATAGTYVQTYYPYESKVCLQRDTYILASRIDYLAPALQAIHILNKYGDPDHAYTNPSLLNGLGLSVTPRVIARWLESKWNGYGLPAFGKDPAYASAVRTNVFAILETILGYKFGDITSRAYADQTMQILIQVQIGEAPFPQYALETTEDGYLIRPNYAGAQFAGWTTGGSYPYGMPPRQFIAELIDQLGMPSEVEGVAPSNLETTATYMQALRVYEFFRWGDTFTRNKALLPRPDIRLASGVNAVTLHVVPADEVYWASELLADIRDQGGTAYRIETYEHGYHDICEWTNRNACAAGTWNFQIHVGRGYLIWTTADSVFRPAGNGLGSDVYVLLAGGYWIETIGVPYVSAAHRHWLNAQQLHGRLVAAGCGAHNLYRFDRSINDWVLLADDSTYEFRPTDALKVTTQYACYLIP